MCWDYSRGETGKTAAGKVELNFKRKLMEGEASVWPRNDVFGQQEPQVSEGDGVNSKSTLYLPEFHRSLSLSLGSQEGGGRQDY